MKCMLLLFAAMVLSPVACGQAGSPERAGAPDAPALQRDSSPIKLHGHRAYWILVGASHAAAAWDTEETLINKRRSTFEERNPLARPFVRLPAPAYRATEQLFSAGSDWISWKMRHSRRKWMRKTWWLPQAIMIENHIRGAIYSHTHR